MIKEQMADYPYWKSRIEGLDNFLLPKLEQYSHPLSTVFAQIANDTKAKLIALKGTNPRIYWEVNNPRSSIDHGDQPRPDFVAGEMTDFGIDGSTKVIKWGIIGGSVPSLVMSKTDLHGKIINKTSFLPPKISQSLGMDNFTIRTDFPNGSSKHNSFGRGFMYYVPQRWTLATTLDEALEIYHESVTRPWNEAVEVLAQSGMVFEGDTLLSETISDTCMTHGRVPHRYF